MYFIHNLLIRYPFINLRILLRLQPKINLARVYEQPQPDSIQGKMLTKTSLLLLTHFTYSDVSPCPTYSNSNMLVPLIFINALF